MLEKSISLKDTRAFVIRGLILAAILIVAASSVHTRSSDARNLLSKTRRSSGGSLFDCGYDPAGASDAWSSHRLNKLRGPGDAQVRLLSKNSNVTAGRATRDISGLAAIEDDGNLVIPAAKFNLKNQSVLLTPQDDGYQVSRSDIEFDNDFGSAIGLFVGADGQFVGDANNAYRDVFLGGARFPFFGSYYETAYVGTNGYITFTQGDTSARISPAALASEIPRIAPLWADLDVTNSGNIYYKRFADHHLFTWNRAGQPLYDGASSFQAVLYDDGRIAFVYKKVKAHA